MSSRSLELAAAAFEERLNRALALVDEKQQQQQQQQSPTPGHSRKDSRDPELWNKTVAMLGDLEIRQRTLDQTRAAVASELEHAKAMMLEARTLWSNAQAMKLDLEAKQARMEQECICKRGRISVERPAERPPDAVDPDVGEEKPRSAMSRMFFKTPTEHEEVKALQWGPILQSKMTMWQRPKRQHVKFLKDEGCSLIISVQSEKELVSEVGKDCSKFGIRWVNIPLDGANEAVLRGEESVTLLLEGLYTAFKLLNNNQEKALLHCATGIHRTGVCTYILARVAGRNKKEASNFLRQLREVTSTQVGDWRLALAEETLIPRLKERIQHQISVNQSVV